MTSQIGQANVGLDLRAGDATPLAFVGTQCVTRGELKRRSDALMSMLAQHAVQRAMVLSDDPVDILRAIDACNRADADLYIAHTNLTREHVDEIVKSHAIQAIIGASDTFEAPGSAGSAPARRIYMMTSGTTGRPKIAMHTLQSLLGRILASAQYPANREARWLLTYQPTGFAGVQVILTAALARGAVVTAPQRKPAAFHEAARQARVTQISGTPTFWRSFLMLASSNEIPLRQITLGGEAADQATLDRLKRRFPQARITHTYASTEAGVVYAVHDGLEGFPRAWLEQPNQGTQLRIRDGFLHIKTANAMRGYVTEARQPLLEDGWLVTSDRAEIRGERVYVLGRDDSTINVAGSKVYPLAVETFLLGLPQVLEARVYGVPNPISGFLVGADVMLAPDQEAAAARTEILTACRERLPGYQVPRVLKFVDSIQVGASGKKG